MRRRSRKSRMLRSRFTTKRKHKQRGGNRKCLFINWGPRIGLGNQLCIYAAAVIIKQSLTNTWDLCIPPVEDNPHTSTDYRFLFKQGRPVERTSDIQSRINAATLIHKNKDIRNGAWNQKDLATNSGDTLKDSSKNLRLKTTEEPEAGYYHNYASIAPAIPTVRPDIQKELTSRYASVVLVEDPATTAFVHIRYGDYHTNNITSPMSYYKEAMKRLEQSSIRTIYIISDEEGIEWAKKEGLPESQKQIQLVNDPDELKVMYIMSQCKAGACISASTYSMWGAILGPQTNDAAIITYPSSWIKISAKELSFPKSWIEI